MKFTSKQKEVAGLSLMATACVLMVGSVACSLRKRSAAAAAPLAAAAALEGTAGLWLLVEGRSRVGEKVSLAREQEYTAEDELFDQEAAKEADARMRGALCGRHDEGEPNRMLREIPRDEEASEEDFL